MIIRSDWHIHSDASYDSTLPISEIERETKAAGFEKFGITDHVNFNDVNFLGNFDASVKSFEELKKRCDRAVLGVELTPIDKPQFDYIAKTGTREGFVAPASDKPYPIELALTKEEMKARGVRYAIGAAHWRVDIPYEQIKHDDVKSAMNEWHRQQMWLACDERVTILGHPWYNGSSLWYEEFTMIPKAHVDELSAALKENGKYVECNSHFFNTATATEKFKHQYAEFLRSLFEMGISITYGSDSHNTYKSSHIATEKYLLDAGFKDGDVTVLDEKALW